MQLRPLMFVIPPLDFLEDKGLQDELLANGVQDLMLGYFRLFDDFPATGRERPPTGEELNWWAYFEDRPGADNPVVSGPYTEGRFVRGYYTTPRRGRLVAPFHPTLELYEGLGVVPPDMPAGLEAKSERLQRLVAGLSSRGFRVYTFGSSDGPEHWLEAQPPCINNPRYDGYIGARLQDYYLHFPTIVGCVTDGPGYGYEITPGFRGGGQLFAPLCTCVHCQEKARAMGMNLAAMQAAAERIKQALHGLSPAQVDLFLESQQGILDALALLFEDPAAIDLLRFKTASVEDSIARIYRAIKAANPKLQYGICPRLPCFAAMQGCNFRRLSQVTDFIQSKHYLWMGGFDGFKGTLARYVQTLREWNPSLDDARLEALICRLLGVRLPDDYRVSDFERPAPKRFFDEVVYRESRKMLQRIGDADKISPFVGLEHGGILLTAEELHYTLQAIADAGLRRFTYFILNSVSDEIWAVIREFTAVE
jgi:hypothetical protein